MKIGDRVEIKENAKYTGQDMAWTETRTSSEITRESIKAYHYSDKKISSFVPKITCFFDSFSDFIEGYIYEVTIPKGCHVNRYDSEIRVELNEEMSLKYIGRNQRNYDYKNGGCGNPTIITNSNTIFGKSKTIIAGINKNRKEITNKVYNELKKAEDKVEFLKSI